MVRQEWKEIARLRLKGERFHGEDSWRNALEELQRFRRSVAQAAAAFWLAAHPHSDASLRRFDETIQLRTLRLEGAETVASLDVLRSVSDQAPYPAPDPEEVTRTIHRIWQLLSQAAADRLQAGPIETPLAAFLSWGLLLPDDEEIELAPLGESPVRLSASRLKDAYLAFLSSHRGGAPGGREEREPERLQEPKERLPIEEILASIAAGIPAEEWDKVPADLSYNLDHYLYGAPRK